MVPDGLQGLGEQHQAFLLHVDHPTLSRFQLPARGAAHIHQKRHGNLAFTFVPPVIDPVGRVDAGPPFRHVTNRGIQVQVFAMVVAVDPLQARGPHGFKIASQDADSRGMLFQNPLCKILVTFFAGTLDHPAPFEPVVLDAAVPFRIHVRLFLTGRHWQQSIARTFHMEIVVQDRPLRH